MFEAFEPFASYRELTGLLSLSEADKEFVARSRQAIIDSLFGNEGKLVLFIGPCSVHNSEAILAYASWLKTQEAAYGDKILFVMRTYVEKSRTAIGWRGLARQPDPLLPEDTEAGIKKARGILLEITKRRLPCAVEIVHPLLWTYWNDLIAWGSVGARNVESQALREMSSAFPFPCGFKNTRNGDTEAALHAMLVAQGPGHTLAIDEDGRLGEMPTSGNRHIHLILRGSYNKPNWHRTPQLVRLLRHAGLPETIVIDASHGNSRKNPLAQFSAMRSTVRLMRKHPVRGLMIESYIKQGAQVLSSLTAPDPECSITDPCLDIPATERLLAELYKGL